VKANGNLPQRSLGFLIVLVLFVLTKPGVDPIFIPKIQVLAKNLKRGS
jgi:hypothetical protein